MLPIGRADDTITEGCLVLEGGGWRGLFTVGVLDALMMNGINLRDTVGISAGALSGLGYVAGQIGWGVRVDLTYRHDSRYCGFRAVVKEGGIMGYNYLRNGIMKELPLDKKKIKESPRRLAVGATNMLTGEIEYFEKDKGNFWKATTASASVPYFSRPVMIKGVPYLDGACAEKIPYPWAEENGEKKIIVVKTREREYRRKEKGKLSLARHMYHDFPKFVESLETVNHKFNVMAEQLEEEERKGNILILAPSEKVTVSKFEGNMEKLGDLYWQGFNCVCRELDRIGDYLKEDVKKVQD